MKLASYLNRTGEVFILDEPTDGLHLNDIHRMTELFSEMVEEGNTLFVIEHNLEVIKTADYVIELGPGGGQDGGMLLFTGRPNEMMVCGHSVTAPYLKESIGG